MRFELKYTRVNVKQGLVGGLGVGEGVQGGLDPENKVSNQMNKLYLTPWPCPSQTQSEQCSWRMT